MKFTATAGEETIIVTRNFQEACDRLLEHYKKIDFKDYKYASIRVQGFWNQVFGYYVLSRIPTNHYKFGEIDTMWGKWAFAYKPIRWVVLRTYRLIYGYYFW